MDVLRTSSPARWLQRIERERKAHQGFRKDADDAVKLYLNEKQSRFNIFFSNTEILRGVTYPGLPRPSVRRRFLQKSPAHRALASAIERTIDYNLDDYDCTEEFNLTNLDWLTSGLGMTRIRYAPSITKDESEEESLVHQAVWCETVPWADFGWQPAATWRQVKWTYIRHYLDREDIKAQFPEFTDVENLQFDRKLNEHQEGDSEGEFAVVYEVFDKSARKVRFLCEGYTKGYIDVRDDPLELVDFFPHPPPLLAVHTSKKLEPRPDCMQYMQQGKDLQAVSETLAELTAMLKVRGVFDASFEQLKDLMDRPNGDLIPIENFSGRFAQGGLESVLATVPLAEIAGVVMQLEARKDQLKQDIFEITGISDVVRGSSKASETLGAQRIKANSFSMRADKKRDAMANFIRHAYCLMAEIIAEHFEPHVIAAISGVEVTPEMIAIMRSDDMREFVIDVETEATDDTAEEQKNRVEYIDASIQLLSQLMPAVNSGALPAQFAKEVLLFGTRPFKAARHLEESIERDLFAQPPQQQQDPEAAAQIAEMQAKAQKMAADIQLKWKELEGNHQLKAAELRAEIALQAEKERARLALNREIAQAEQALKREVAQGEVALKANKTVEELELERAKASGSLEIAALKHQDELAAALSVAEEHAGAIAQPDEPLQEAQSERTVVRQPDGSYTVS